MSLPEDELMRVWTTTPCLSYVTALLLLIALTGCSRSEPRAAEETTADSTSVVAAAPTGGLESTAEAEEVLAAEAGARTVAERLRDVSIAAEIQLALVDAQDLRAFRFEPVVVNQTVILRGHVETLDQRARAASVAAAVAGVSDVVNEITSTERPTAVDGAASATGSAPGPTYHTVRNGDNLWDIARAYDVSVDQISRLNDLDARPLRPGQRLQVE